jgi:hypothetical protein
MNRDPVTVDVLLVRIIMHRLTVGPRSKLNGTLSLYRITKGNEPRNIPAFSSRT